MVHAGATTTTAAANIAATALSLMSGNSSGGDGKSGESEKRNAAQDQMLNKKEIKRMEGGLKEQGLDLHKDIKGGNKTGQIDIYKDKKGNLYLKPKGGKGEGEPLNLNINDF